MQQLLQKQEEQMQKQAAVAAAQAQAGALNLEAQVDQLVAKSLEKRMPPPKHSSSSSQHNSKLTSPVAGSERPSTASALEVSQVLNSSTH